VFFALAAVGKVGHEDRFAGEGPFGHAAQCAQKALVRFRAVTHFCFKGDAVLHVHHRARFSDNGFAGIQFNFHKLQIIAINLIIYFVTFHLVCSFLSGKRVISEK
jgi:hypothetical protein